MAIKTGVLLLHGLTGVPSEMRPIEKHLQRMGFDTETPTLAGHGSTNEDLLAATWKDWIASAEAALDNLASRVDQVVVCGLSMGASISAILAARHPERVCGLIILSPTLCYDSPDLTKKWYLRVYSTELARDFVSKTISLLPIVGRLLWWNEVPPYGLKDERLQRQITKAIEAAERGEDTKFGLFRTYFISLHHMNYISREFVKVAREIHCPSLVVSSLEDTLVSTSNATNTYSYLASRNKSLAMLTGCDHVLTLDLQRNYVGRLVGEFMEAVTGVADPAGAKYNKSGLTLEIHNRLNPLSNADWVRLVPGSPSLADFGMMLQAANVHESQCQTIVVRWNNEPILMVPLVFLRRELNVQIGWAPQMVASFLRVFAPAKLSPTVALFGISENTWGSRPAADVDADKLKLAWETVERVTKEMSASYSATVTGFVHSELKTVSAARTHFVNRPSMAQWLAMNAILEPASVHTAVTAQPQALI